MKCENPNCSSGGDFLSDEEILASWNLQQGIIYIFLFYILYLHLYICICIYIHNIDNEIRGKCPHCNHLCSPHLIVYTRDETSNGTLLILILK